VFWRVALVAAGSFLQRGLGVLSTADAAFDRGLPESEHDVASGIEPAFDEARAKHRFHHVAEDVVAVGGAIIAGLPTETDVVGRADLACDHRAGLPADQRVEPLRQFAFVPAVAIIEMRRDRQAEHPIAEELEPLVVARRPGAAVGQRFDPQRVVGNRKADTFEPSVAYAGEPAKMPLPSRSQRAA